MKITSGEGANLVTTFLFSIMLLLNVMQYNEKFLKVSQG
jgi:hypothetical protein